MRRRFLIIHNPKAGQKGRGLLNRVIRELEKAEAAITLHSADGAAGNQAFAQNAALAGQYDAIIAAGGDGTIRGVAAGLEGTGIPLGIIPLGTGNVLAHELGLKRKAAPIADCLLRGEARPLGGASANGQPFFLMAGVGLDAKAVATLEPEAKRRWGKLAYLWPLARELMEPVPQLEIDIDGAPYSASWAIITNVSRYAGSFKLLPAPAVSAPRQLHAVLSQAKSRHGLVMDMVYVALGRSKAAPHLKFVSCQRASIRSRQPIPVQVDGEVFGVTPIDVVRDLQEIMVLSPRTNGRDATPLV